MEYQALCFCELIKNVIHPSGENSLDHEVDWSYLVQLAKEHNLLPVFLEAAVKHPSYIARSEYTTEMGIALSIVAAQAKRTTAFLKLYEEFAKEGIYPIVMKGLICRELYGRFCDHRPSGDEDILIRPAEYWRAKDVLIANGYVTEWDSETEEQLQWLQEVSYIHPTEKLHIELHLNPMGRQNNANSHMSDYFDNVFENYREVEIQEIKIRTMNHQEHLLFLILHAFRHFTEGGFGIRQMLDILLYQERYGAEIDLKRLHETLKSFRADAFWADVLHVGNSYFGFKLPVLQTPNCPQELLEDMIRCGAFGNSTQAERTAARATRLAAGNYLKNKNSNSVVMIWKAIFPSKAYLLYYAPYLEEKPWLLPVAWIKRWGRFIKRSRENDGNLAAESVKISQRRMKLLKKYDLV